MMGLGDKTALGVTFGEIISIICLSGALAGGYSSINVRIAEIESKTIYLEQSRKEEMQRSETKRIEDQKSFEKLNDKLDLILIHNDQAQYAK
jgi:uncharacterized protein YcfJ